MEPLPAPTKAVRSKDGRCSAVPSTCDGARWASEPHPRAVLIPRKLAVVATVGFRLAELGNRRGLVACLKSAEVVDAKM
jgi:hypothetical protein